MRLDTRIRQMFDIPVFSNYCDKFENVGFKNSTYLVSGSLSTNPKKCAQNSRSFYYAQTAKYTVYHHAGQLSA